jgi:hypothetical protein
MTTDLLEARPIRSKKTDFRLALSCDRSGVWMLSAADRPATEFTDFDAALDRARQISSSKTAPIEVWQDGEYICCLVPDERACRHPSPPAREVATLPLLPRTERVANRAAQMLMAVAGPLFWLALGFVAVAASLGWKLLLL